MADSGMGEAQFIGGVSYALMPGGGFEATQGFERRQSSQFKLVCHLPLILSWQGA
jgi:hypothetical protein